MSAHLRIYTQVHPRLTREWARSRRRPHLSELAEQGLPRGEVGAGEPLHRHAPTAVPPRQVDRTEAALPQLPFNREAVILVHQVAAVERGEALGQVEQGQRRRPAARRDLPPREERHRRPDAGGRDEEEEDQDPAALKAAAPEVQAHAHCAVQRGRGRRSLCLCLSAIPPLLRRL